MSRRYSPTEGCLAWPPKYDETRERPLYPRLAEVVGAALDTSPRAKRVRAIAAQTGAILPFANGLAKRFRSPLELMEVLNTRGILPDAWMPNPRRQFEHLFKTNRLAGYNQFKYRDRPQRFFWVVAIASDVEGLTAAEALAQEVFGYPKKGVRWSLDRNEMRLPYAIEEAANLAAAEHGTTWGALAPYRPAERLYMRHARAWDACARRGWTIPERARRELKESPLYFTESNNVFRPLAQIDCLRRSVGRYLVGAIGGDNAGWQPMGLGYYSIYDVEMR